MASQKNLSPDKSVQIATFVVERLKTELRLKGEINLLSMMRRVQIDLEVGTDGFTGKKIIQHRLSIDEIVVLVDTVVKYIRREKVPANIDMPVRACSMTHLALLRHKMFLRPSPSSGSFECPCGCKKG